MAFTATPGTGAGAGVQPGCDDVLNKLKNTMSEERNTVVPKIIAVPVKRGLHIETPCREFNIVSTTNGPPGNLQRLSAMTN